MSAQEGGILSKLYYDPGSVAGYGGVNRLVREAEKRGIKPAKTRRWLKSQLTYTLHRPAVRRFRTSRVVVQNIDDQWQADLVDMQFCWRQNDGFRYLVTVIDVLSKYAWVVPLKDKTGDSLIAAFDHIFKTSGRKPQRLQTDAGIEFLNRKFQAFLRRQGVHHFVTYNQTKAQIAERFNRTLKEKMWRYFQHVQKWRYIDVLPKLVWSYNHSVHRSIKMRPADVTWENMQQVWHTLYDGMMGERHQTVPAFQVGDEVRITKAKGTFQKGYEQNWTEEVFKVARVNTVRSPPVYSLVEEDGTPIKGTFYAQELQKVEVRERDVYRIEKVIRTRGRRRNKEFLVKWAGWPDKYNSWIRASTVQLSTNV